MVDELLMFGLEFREGRQALGISQDAVAAMIAGSSELSAVMGSDDSTVSKWESDNREMPPALVELLLKEKPNPDHEERWATFLKERAERLKDDAYYAQQRADAAARTALRNQRKRKGKGSQAPQEAQVPQPPTEVVGQPAPAMPALAPGAPAGPRPISASPVAAPAPAMEGAAPMGHQAQAIANPAQASALAPGAANPPAASPPVVPAPQGGATGAPLAQVVAGPPAQVSASPAAQTAAPAPGAASPVMSPPAVASTPQGGATGVPPAQSAGAAQPRLPPTSAATPAPGSAQTGPTHPPASSVAPSAGAQGAAAAVSPPRRSQGRGPPRAATPGMRLPARGLPPAGAARGPAQPAAAAIAIPVPLSWVAVVVLGLLVAVTALSVAIAAMVLRGPSSASPQVSHAEQGKPAENSSAESFLPEPLRTLLEGLSIPAEPVKGQARPPCPSRGNKVINGSCWVGPVEGMRAPCPELFYDYEGKCYQPQWVRSKKEPNTLDGGQPQEP